MKATKRQAAYNGEVGANGRAYNKGQFIAEQPGYVGSATKKAKPAKVSKQQIERYLWEVPADAEMKSIYNYIQGVFGSVETGEINEESVAFYGVSHLKVQDLIARYQAGERWFFSREYSAHA
jgi:hypothetical protein